MADVIKTVGTTARDYATWTLWEAAHGGAAGGAGNVAIGEGYDDSAFDEGIVINDATPDSAIMRPATGEGHDGTEGTGVRIVNTVITGGTELFTATVGISVEDIEWDGNGNKCKGVKLDSGATAINAKRLIVHDIGNGDHSASAVHGMQIDAALGDIMDCIVYDVDNINAATRDAYGIWINVSGSRVASLWNCTVHDVVNDNGSGAAYGIEIDDEGNKTVKNCITTDTGGSTSGTKQDYNLATPSNAVMDHNLASDTSASGTGSLDSKTSANQYVSNSAPYDLHIKAGADAIDAGVDLVTTPTGVNIDINGRDRDSEGDIWDMGAHELVVAAAGVEIFRRRIEGY